MTHFTFMDGEPCYGCQSSAHRTEPPRRRGCPVERTQSRAVMPDRITSGCFSGLSTAAAEKTDPLLLVDYNLPAHVVVGKPLSSPLDQEDFL